MEALGAVLDALAALAWPLLAAVVLLKLYPSFKRIVESRGFAVKVGDMEVTVQEASEQFRAQLEDLQAKVSELRTAVFPGTAPGSNAGPAGVAPPSAAPARPRRILWVDDQPSNNAFEIATLREAGVAVLEALSTSDALRALGSQAVDLVITDMGREEAGTYRPDAGLELIRAARAAAVAVPIYVYTTSRNVRRYREEAVAAGGQGATASAVELFEMLGALEGRS